MPEHLSIRNGTERNGTGKTSFSRTGHGAASEEGGDSLALLTQGRAEGIGTGKVWTGSHPTMLFKGLNGKREVFRSYLISIQLLWCLLFQNSPSWLLLGFWNGHPFMVVVLLSRKASTKTQKFLLTEIISSVQCIEVPHLSVIYGITSDGAGVWWYFFNFSQLSEKWKISWLLPSVFSCGPILRDHGRPRAKPEKGNNYSSKAVRAKADINLERENVGTAPFPSAVEKGNPCPFEKCSSGNSAVE